MAMKTLRDRMKHMNLSISTKEAGPGARRKTIMRVTDEMLFKRYKLRGQVMESTHSGMEVLFATRLADGVEVVIKTRDRAVSFKSGSEEREWRDTTEVQLNMPKVESMCEYLEVLETKDKYYVVMEKVNGKDLFETMAQERIKQIDSREILRQMLEALNTMHNAGRIHKDLKLENVVVDLCSPKNKKTPTAGGAASPPGSPAEAKLIDFDTVQDWEPSSPKTRDVLGTDGYIAPEAYGGVYSPSSDIYCVGVIMYKLLTGKFPSRADIFDDMPGENWVGSPAMRRIQERLKKEKIDFTRFPLDQCKEASSLCQMMLAFEPQDRPSAEDALKHAWFALPDDKVKTPRRR